MVLCDIGLPGMSGYEVAERLRERGIAGGRDGAVLIALTGYGDDDARARGRKAGFDHHLVKPVEPNGLTSLLEDVRARREADAAS